MTIHWLQPAALWGLALLIVPILVHLLVRQQSHPVPFPSLRFVPGVRLSAVRRRVINEWPLLAIRAAAIAAAVLALAVPVVVSHSRNQVWQSRATRAFVIDGVNPSAVAPDIAAVIAGEHEESFASAEFRAVHLADSIRKATTWLEQQPISSKEIVIAGDLRVGGLSWTVVQGIPRQFGIRFLPFLSASQPRTHQFAGAVTTDRLTTRPLRVMITFGDGQTQVSYQPDVAAPSPIAVRAADRDQRAADAALSAMWANAPLIQSADRRVIVVFDGADDRDLQPIRAPADAAWMREALERLHGLRGGQRGDRLIVYAGLAPSNGAAPALLSRIASAALTPDLKSIEPQRISVADLARWSRAPSPELDPTLPMDEGDRRWMWALALGLLLVELVVRGRRRDWQRLAVPTSRPDEEQRIA